MLTEKLLESGANFIQGIFKLISTWEKIKFTFNFWSEAELKDRLSIVRDLVSILSAVLPMGTVIFLARASVALLGIRLTFALIAFLRRR